MGEPEKDARKTSCRWVKTDGKEKKKKVSGGWWEKNFKRVKWKQFEGMKEGGGGKGTDPPRWW